MSQVTVHAVEQITPPNGRFVFNPDRSDLPLGFEIRDRSFIRLGPWEQAGNHKHQRAEALIALTGGIEFVWVDETTGDQQTELMRPDQPEQLKVFVIAPWVAHAVMNNSHKEGFLYECSDLARENSPYERVQVIRPGQYQRT